MAEDTSWREERKHLVVDKGIHHDVRLLAALKKKTIKETLKELIDEELKKSLEKVKK